MNNDKTAKDKLHANLEETKDVNELTYDKTKKTYELDVKKGEEKDYDHPMNYDTIATGSVDDDSTYDEANPYVGDEYANKKETAEDELEELAMHIDEGESVIVDPEDELLSRTEEDYRDDLDEEGYPKNDKS